MTAPSRDDAAALDQADPLAPFRERFLFAGESPIYMDGNSLGRLPKETVEVLLHTLVSEWGLDLVESWERWIDLPQRVGAGLAGLIGADPDEVTLSDSTSVNLYKLAVAALDATPDRSVIVTDAGNFPTDRYLLAGIAEARGLELRLLDCDPIAGPTAEDVGSALDDDVALVSLSHVAFRSGALADMAAINKEVRRAGALSLWDLSHSVGAVPIDLQNAGCDLAVGCTYKYLNGGPGAPAFLFVRGALQETLRQPVWGWFGHADQFAFEPAYRPANGIERFLVGSPPIIAVAAASVGIDIVAEAGIERIRDKSLAATAMMLELYDAWLAPLGVALGTPREPKRRGSHLSFLHPEGLSLSRWLRAEGGVVVDFRPPDAVRMALAPLYTSFVEMWDAVDALRRGLEDGSHRAFDMGAGRVT
jgi:kynureninase